MLKPCRRLARRGRASRALPPLIALCFGLIVLSIAPRAEAYTWMIKHGYGPCNACHVDPSGGELLTAYGRAISEAFLSSKWGSSDESASSGGNRLSRWERRQMARALSLSARAKFADPDDAEEAEEEEEEEEAETDGEKLAGKDDAKGKPDEEEETEEGGEEEPASEESASESEESSTEEAESESASRPFYDPFFGLFGLPEAITLGGSVRLASIYNDEAETKLRLFPMQADLYGDLRVSANIHGQASIGISKVKAGSVHGRAAQITSNQGDGYRLISRTHWLAFDFGEGAHSIRIGRLNLPFGVRIPEHTMWVRERTETDRESDQQHGIALAMILEKVRFELMGIVGNYQSSPDEFRERGYSGFIEMMVAERSAVGMSSLVTYAKNDRFSPEDGQPTMRQAHGVFLRSGIGEMLAVLGEVNAIARSRKELGYAGFLQLDFEPVRGVHLIGTVEGANTGYPSNPTRLEGVGTPVEVTQERLKGNGELQLGYWIGANWFFLPHFDMRVDAIFRQEEPMQILSQLHVYL